MYGVNYQTTTIFMATIIRPSDLVFLFAKDTNALKLSSEAFRLMINNDLKSLPVLFLSESDLKYDVEAVTLQMILSANGVPTATLPVSMTNEPDMKPEFCKNRPMYIFVTSGPPVQEFLKQVG
jgi:hypothetical protein